MPYQHFFMSHDVTWAQQSKQASSALENNVAPIRSRRYFTQRSASCPHRCLDVARYALTSLTLLWLGKESLLSLHSLYATFASDAANLLETNTNRSLGNRKLRSNCRIVQRTGISPAPYPCSAYPPCAVERQRSPLATERGRSILHCYSIVIASLLDMIMGNKPRSRQHRAEIERPKWVVRAVS